MPSPPLIDYPSFPVNVFQFYPLRLYTDDVDKRSLDTITSLQLTYPESIELEKKTVEQARNTIWHQQRKHRFTASKFLQFNKIKKSQGFISYAKSLLFPKDPNYFLQKKFEYGRVNEPVALRQYELFFKSRQHPLQVLSCGFVVQPNAYILGASPDGKVIDTQEESIFGLVEIKCPEKYADYNLADVALVEKGFCMEVVNDKIVLKKDHPYYDQVQMQMAITGIKWCDFVVYSRKSLLIDRVRFNNQYWLDLQRKIYEFYFRYYIPCQLEEY